MWRMFIGLGIVLAVLGGCDDKEKKEKACMEQEKTCVSACPKQPHEERMECIGKCQDAVSKCVGTVYE